jgi:hypothetical protein
MNKFRKLGFIKYNGGCSPAAVMIPALIRFSLCRTAESVIPAGRLL